MTLTILASVSLLALVTSARPLPKPDGPWKSLQLSAESAEPTDIQHAIHTVVKSHASIGEDLEKEGDVHVHIASVEEVQAFLSNADNDVVKAVIPLSDGELHSPDEKELYEILNRLEHERGRGSPIPDDALNTMSIGSPSNTSSIKELFIDEEESDNASPSRDNGFSASKPVIAIAASCIISFLALCCIAASLYIVEVLRKSVLQSPTAWDILPQLEKSAVERSGQTNGVSHVSHDTGLEDEPDEKFFDAETPDVDSPESSYATPILGPVNLPPSLPSLAAAIATVAAVAVTNTSVPEMSETPISARPSWSIRASEAKLPTIEPSQSHAEVVHTGAPREERRHAFNAMPELDAALAMQLRPGLGLGADAAWLVRFVMALFGWCAVLMSGGTQRR